MYLVHIILLFEIYEPKQHRQLDEYMICTAFYSLGQLRFKYELCYYFDGVYYGITKLFSNTSLSIFLN